MGAPANIPAVVFATVVRRRRTTNRYGPGLPIRNRRRPRAGAIADAGPKSAFWLPAPSLPLSSFVRPTATDWPDGSLRVTMERSTTCSSPSRPRGATRAAKFS